MVCHLSVGFLSWVEYLQLGGWGNKHLERNFCISLFNLDSHVCLFISEIVLFLLFSQGLRGLWLWTVTLFSFRLFLRGEEPPRLKVRH